MVTSLQVPNDIAPSSAWSESAYYTDALEGDPDEHFSQWDNMSDAHRSTATLSTGDGTDREPTPQPVYFEERIAFISEDGKRIWTELASLFTEESAAFAALVNSDIRRSHGSEVDHVPALQGITHDGPPGSLRYRLLGVTPFDFDSLLMGLKPKLGREIPFERLCPLLVLATDWEFADIRNYCIQEISKLDDLPVPRIMLARRAHVPQWLLNPYVTLAERLAPLTQHEADLLDAPAVEAITKAREAVIQRRTGLISCPRPPILLGKWTVFHAHCWPILSGAWRKVLTEAKYHHTSPADAMIQALKDVRKEEEGKGRSLCRNCNSQLRIVGWLDLFMDHAIARSYLEDCIANIEPWAGPGIL